MASPSARTRLTSAPGSSRLATQDRKLARIIAN